MSGRNGVRRGCCGGRSSEGCRRLVYNSGMHHFGRCRRVRFVEIFVKVGIGTCRRVIGEQVLDQDLVGNGVSSDFIREKDGD